MCGRRLADVAKTLSDGMIEHSTLDPGERDVAMDGITNPSRRGQLRHRLMMPALPDALRRLVEIHETHRVHSPRPNRKPRPRFLRDFKSPIAG